jgi:hypothetical protein
VAGVVQKTLELLQTGELDLARANSIRESAKTLVHLWELEADVLRRRHAGPRSFSLPLCTRVRGKGTLGSS